ncbi:hypothetical protein [Tunicatimonas pelagia]|uniref:hypothetical protein n=1 Tax=Tunicatimonas pelagia TaxID=931531 RepID=UPI0026651D5B|nr:hypothetical protein [Tunicatimonas pelagia]WKN46306.1 hypothetical protein P0M28_15260 [Tunicatimonas pelagia]
MKQTLLVLLIVLNSVLSVQIVLAQSDTVTITYSEEAADSSDFSLKEKYKYWTRANVEEKSMFKIGLSSIGWGGGPFVGYHFAYERKIGVPFSILAQYEHNVTGWDNNSLGFGAATRYYYLMPGLIKKGKSANNLSSLYLSLQAENIWSSHRDAFLSNNSVMLSERQIQRIAAFSLLQGIQLRLGKYGYLDANLGYRYSPSLKRDYVELNFSVGVAF